MITTYDAEQPSKGEMSMSRQPRGSGHPAESAGAFAVCEDGRRGFLLLLAARGPEDIEAERRAQEDAAIGAEDILTQAEEANAVSPVG